MQVHGGARATQALQLHEGPLVERLHVPAASWKACHYIERGHWGGGGARCTAWRYVSSLCVKVEFAADAGEWRLSRRYGGVGCGHPARQQAVSYTRLPVHNWRKPEPPRISAAQARDRHVCCCSVPAFTCLPAYAVLR